MFARAFLLLQTDCIMVQPEDQLVGRVLGGYRIDEVLSTGPMGKIYKAFQLSVERHVALKFLATALLGNSEVTEAFVAGAKAAASLNHRNIVRVHDVCREEGYLFYSMEYVAGGSFRDRIRAKALPASAWAGVLWGVNSGLLHAQQNGVHHPQLIPEHFLFSETGEVKILNLGLAASMEPVRRSLGVRFQDWVFYSPPEGSGGSGSGRQGEVFSAGCSLYHLMAGEPPFAGTTVEQVVARKKSREPMELQERVSMASAEVSGIVARMIDRDPGVRYMDFSELNEEVAVHCEPGTEGAYPGRKILTLALGALVLAAAAWLLLRPGAVEDPASKEITKPVSDSAGKGPTLATGPGQAAEPPGPPARPPEGTAEPSVSKPAGQVEPPGGVKKPEVKKPVQDVPAGKPGLEFSQPIKRGDEWRLFRGRVAPPSGWSRPAFDDSGWEKKPSGFGYSSSESELKTVKTRLDDMSADGYLSVYIRRSFQVEDPAGISKLRLKLLIDDGFVAFLNGVEVARHNIKAKDQAFDMPADYIENPEGDLRSYDLGKHLSLLHPGSNTIAIQGHNQSLTSSDFVLTPTIEVLTSRPGLSSQELEELELELSLLAEDQVGGYLELRDYRKALLGIRDLEFRFKGYQELERWEKKVLEGIESDLAVTLLRAENLLELGEFEKTNELIEDFNSRTPRKYRKRVQPVLDAVKIGEGIAQGAVGTVASAEVAVLVAIEKGDFEAAEKVLAGIPAVPGKALNEEIDRIRMVLATSRWAWEKMLLGLRKYRGKRELLVPIEPAGEDGVVPAFWLHSYKKPDGVKAPLAFQRKSGELYRCDLIDLPLPALMAFLRAGAARNEPGEVDQVVQLYGAGAGLSGVEVLLLCRKGPRLALESLAAIAEGERSGLEKWIHHLGRRLLESSVLQATAFVKIVEEEAEAAAGKEAVDWQVFLENIEDLVSRHRTLPYFKEFREQVQALYALAADHVLKDSGLSGLVAARVKERNLAKKKGVIQLSYDFSSQDQLADFSLLEGTVRIEDGLLVLSGECRLLHGNPFREAIEVKLVASGYTPTSPNINIALWTREGDLVTSKFKPVKDPVENPDPEIEELLDTLPSGYLAFCLGYNVGAPFREFGNNKDLPVSPAFVITSGAMGKRIPVISTGHLGARFAYTYWTESVGNRLGGRQNITLALGPKAFTWTTNSLKLHRLAQRKKTRLFPWLSNANPLGSISLFTNGNENYYDYLVVEAELNPGWLEIERKRRILADFAALEAGN